MRNGDQLILTRCQRGWRCDVTVSAATSEQFTDLTFHYVTDSGWWWLAVLKGWVGAHRLKRRLEKAEAPLRAEKGWG